MYMTIEHENSSDSTYFDINWTIVPVKRLRCRTGPFLNFLPF